MDLKLSKTKLEIIKKVEESENGALLDWILQELESKRPFSSDQIQPMTEEEYRTEVEIGLKSARKDTLYTSQEIRTRYANRTKSTPA